MKESQFSFTLYLHVFLLVVRRDHKHHCSKLGVHSSFLPSGELFRAGGLEVCPPCDAVSASIIGVWVLQPFSWPFGSAFSGACAFLGCRESFTAYRYPTTLIPITFSRPRHLSRGS